MQINLPMTLYKRVSKVECNLFKGSKMMKSFKLQYRYTFLIPLTNLDTESYAASRCSLFIKLVYLRFLSELRVPIVTSTGLTIWQKRYMPWAPRFQGARTYSFRFFVPCFDAQTNIMHSSYIFLGYYLF
jgi:hypothetical protein